MSFAIYQEIQESLFYVPRSNECSHWQPGCLSTSLLANNLLLYLVCSISQEVLGSCCCCPLDWSLREVIQKCTNKRIDTVKVALISSNVDRLTIGNSPNANQIALTAVLRQLSECKRAFLEDDDVRQCGLQSKRMALVVGLCVLPKIASRRSKNSAPFSG